MIDTFFSLPAYIYVPLVLIGYCAACLGSGILILSLINGRAKPGIYSRVSAGTTLATAFILGEGGLASLWLLLALGGWLSFRVVVLLALFFTLCGLYVGRDIFPAFVRQAASIFRELGADTWGWQAIAWLTVLLCLAWVTSLGRPLAGDGPAFYFALGKFIASSHRLIPMPGFEGFTNIGMQGELHYAALMVLHSPAAAKLFSWPTIIAAGVMLASLGRVTGMGRRGQWLTLGILFSSTAVVWLSGDGKVDLFGAALGLAAYYWAAQIRFDRSNPTLLLTGLLSGFSIVAKLSYAPVMVPSIALLVVWGYWSEVKDNSQWLSFLKPFAHGSLIIIAGLIISFTPHFVKNGLLFNNPVSPLGSGGMGWLNQVWYGPEMTRHILLTYPLALTYGSYWAQYGNLSPLILAFLPLAFFLPRPRSLFASPLAAITFVALVAVGAWILYNPSVFSPRYILASLLLLALLPARAAEYVSLNDQRPRLMTFGIMTSAIVVMAAIGLYFLDNVFFPNDTVQYLMGTMDECDRDSRYTLHCKPMEAINRKAALGERVYFATYQHYWLRGDLLQCLSNDKDYIPADVDDAQFWLELYKKGFTFIFIDKSTHNYLLEQLDLNNPPAWVKLIPVYRQDYLLAYRMKFTDPPTDVMPMICRRQPSSTIWEVVSPY